MSRNRKKVLFVAEAMGGGVFTFLVGLCNELVDYYDIFVAYGIRTQTPDDFRKYLSMILKRTFVCRLALHMSVFDQFEVFSSGHRLQFIGRTLQMFGCCGKP